MRILLVDDETAAIMNFIQTVLNKIDLDYTLFNEYPLDSVDYAKHNEVDAAFLDIRMPTIDGVELAEQLVAVRPNIKIVFISGYEQNEEEIRAKLKDNLIGFCNKPYSQDTLLGYLARINTGQNKRQIMMNCFGGFNVLVNGIEVKFNCAKSREMLAVLVDRHGRSVEMGEMIAMLWGEKDVDKAKRLYRNAIMCLRMSLSEYGIDDILVVERARMSLVVDDIDCDYWNIDDPEVLAKYNFRYMLMNYEWITETAVMIEKMYCDKFGIDAIKKLTE